MLDGFLDTIRNLGIFVICAKMIVHFRPKEADEKYMKLLISMMVLLQLLLPLKGQLTQERKEFALTWEEIQGAVEEVTREEEKQEKGFVDRVQIEPVKRIAIE